MKLVLLSDTHGYHGHIKDMPEGDVLIHAGDVTQDIGRASLRDFLKWFESQPHKHKIFIAGNHDGALQRWHDLARLMIKEVAPSVTYLQDSGITIDGINIWGSPYTPTFMNWFFMEDRGKDIKRHWDMIPNDTDVLVTHGPPFGILDISAHDMQNWGDTDLLEAVKRVQPKLHVFGHFHHPYGTKEINWGNGKKTTFANVTFVDEAYKPTNKPLIFDL